MSVFRYDYSELLMGKHRLTEFDEVSKNVLAYMITDTRALYDAVHRQE